MGLCRKIVIDKRNNQVVSHGFVDFGSMTDAYPDYLYLIVDSDFVFDPELDKQHWYWDGTTFTTTVQ